MSDISIQTNQQACLKYWQQAFVRSSCNRIDYKLDSQTGLRVSKSDILVGQINPEFVSGEAQTVWIGLEVAQHKNTTQETYLIPLWFAAELDHTGKLSCHPRLNYPWIPSVLLDPLSRGPLLGLLPQMDEAWAYFFQKNDQGNLNWSDFIQQSLKFLIHIAGAAWQDKITEAGYQFIDEGIILFENKFQFRPSSLLNNFMSLEEQPFQEELTNEVLLKKIANYPGVSYQDAKLTEEDLKAFLHASELGETQLLSVTAPAGSQKQVMIWNLAVYQCLQAALQSAPFPRIVYVGQHAPDFKHPKLDLISMDPLNLKASLEAEVAVLKSGLALIEAYQTGASSQIDIEQSIEGLQKEDQALEEKADQLNATHSRWREANARRSFFQKIWENLSAGKRKKLEKTKAFYDSYLKPYFTLEETTPLDEQIITVLRAIKVQRTKLHNQLMTVTDSLTRGNTTRAELVNWFKTHLGLDLCTDDETPLSLSKTICERLGVKILQLLASFWHTQGETELISVLALSDLERLNLNTIDWLMLDHSELISPMETATHLYRVKRLLAFGDMANQISVPLFPRRMDDFEIKQLGLAEDDDGLEDLQFKGMTASNSTFELVQDKSAFKRMAAHGLLAQNELRLIVMPHHTSQILTYANRCVYAHKLQGAVTLDSKPALGYYHVRGTADLALLDWIQQTDVPVSDIGIITLFEHQKDALSLSLASCDVEIRTIAQANDFSRQTILFVPGYTLFDKKPYAFDQGEQLFNRAFLCAYRQFLVFSDMAIFDPKTHSPSGHVAKMLFKLSPLPLTVLIEQNSVQGEESHREILQGALQAQHSLTIVSQGLDLKSIQKVNLDGALQQLREQGVRVTLYVGTLGIIGQGVQSKAFKHQVSVWQKIGISVFLVRNLHSNAIWWDEHHFIEGQFPWLAGFGKSAGHPFVSLLGDDKLKISFQSYLGVHSVRAPANVSAPI
ncbi:MAG: hypothetical protein U1E78_03205 [Gammaproteobacteria bacterium]